MSRYTQDHSAGIYVAPSGTMRFVSRNGFSSLQVRETDENGRGGAVNRWMGKLRWNHD